MLLLWTSLFCGVAVLYFSTAKSYDAAKWDSMVRMQTSAGLLMFSDAKAYLFQGFPGSVGFWKTERLPAARREPFWRFIKFSA